MNRIIRYAIHKDDGIVVSQVGDKIAWPILEYDAMLPENNFATQYHLESIPVVSVGREWVRLKWTRKIPIRLKNMHREFWGMNPISNTEEQSR